VHAALWSDDREERRAPNVEGPRASLSYEPYRGSVHPDAGTQPTPEEIRADLKELARYTRAIRTYSSTGGGELVPAIANEFGLKVSLGIWIDKNEKRNQREIARALELVRKNRNITSLLVGNETIYRDELTVPQLMEIIHK